MMAEDYARQLEPILRSSTKEIAERLERFQSAANEFHSSVDSVLIEVFVDQDAEGPFDVWARFIGENVFLLDRRFDDDRHLFGVEWGEDGWEPQVPSRPRGWSRADLETAVLDAVDAWISPIIPPGSTEGFWQIGTPN